jgi:hypothetical protein
VGTFRIALERPVPKGTWFVVGLSKKGHFTLLSLSLDAIPLIKQPIDETGNFIAVGLTSPPKGRLAWAVGVRQLTRECGAFLVESDGTNEVIVKLGMKQDLAGGAVWFGEKVV